MNELKDIAKGIKALTSELKRIRKIMESWDEDPDIDEELNPEAQRHYVINNENGKCRRNMIILA